LSRFRAIVPVQQTGRPATQEEKVSDLGKYHHSDEPPDKTKKMVAWIVIAVILIVGAGYVIHSGMFSSDTAQSAKTYPRGL